MQSSDFTKAGIDRHFFKTAVKGVTGGLMSEAMGGDFRSGFIGAAAAEFSGSAINRNDSTQLYTDVSVARLKEVHKRTHPAK